MTNKKQVKVTAPSAPAPKAVESAPAPVEEIVSESAPAVIPEKPAEKVGVQPPTTWLVNIQLNDDYTVAATPADSNMDSNIMLFDHIGGAIRLGTIHISPQATETDVQRVVKKLAASIIAGLSRAPSLL